MAWWIWAFIALLVIGLSAVVSAGIYAFCFTIKRKPTSDYSDEEQAKGTHYEPFSKRLRAARNWLLAQKTEDVFIQSRDGLKLHAVYFPADEPGKKAVLCVHGYHSTGVNDFSVAAKYYHENGFDMLMIDHRAHGQSEGRYIGFGVLERYDVVLWAEYLAARMKENAEILLDGVSMGAASVLMASSLRLPGQVAGIIADCGFTSPKEIIGHVMDRYLNMPHKITLAFASLVCRITAGYWFSGCSTVNEVKKTQIPILFVHGSKDTFVPVDMTTRNYEACASRKRMLIVPGARHAESYVTDTAAYEQAVNDFFDMEGMG